MQNDNVSQISGSVPSHGRRQGRSWRLPALILVLFLLVLRETGVISLNLYKSNSQSSWSSSFLSQTSGTGSKNQATETNSVSSGYFIETTGDRVAGKTIKSVLASAPAPSANSTRVSVTKFDIEGTYWLPLYKSGICRFAANATRSPSANAHYKGTISGTIELKVIGLCSSYEFRKKLGQQVASAIAKEKWDTRTK